MTTPDPGTYRRDITAVATFAEPIIQRGHELHGAPLPPLGTPAWRAAEDAVQLASVAQYALLCIEELDPGVIAARLAGEIALGRARAMRQASRAISEAHDWTHQASQPSFEELEQRRSQPGPLAREVA